MVHRQLRAKTGLMHRSKRRLYSITSSARTSREDGTSRPGALAIDDQFVLGRRLHRKVGGVCAPQDAIDIRRRLSKRVDEEGRLLSL
jgi:hypothetical protein